MSVSEGNTPGKSNESAAMRKVRQCLTFLCEGMSVCPSEEEGLVMRKLQPGEKVDGAHLVRQATAMTSHISVEARQGLPASKEECAAEVCIAPLPFPPVCSRKLLTDCLLQH